MEVDTVHAMIEKALKNTIISIPFGLCKYFPQGQSEWQTE